MRKLTEEQITEYGLTPRRVPSTPPRTPGSVITEIDDTDDENERITRLLDDLSLQVSLLLLESNDPQGARDQFYNRIDTRFNQNRLET